MRGNYRQSAKELFQAFFYPDVGTAQKAHHNHSTINVPSDLLLGSRAIYEDLDFIIEKSEKMNESSSTSNHKNWIKVNRVDIRLRPGGGAVQSSGIISADFVCTNFVNIRMNELVSKDLGYEQRDTFEEVDATEKIGPTYGYKKYKHEMESRLQIPAEFRSV
jgi:hypothetical protein